MQEFNEQSRTFVCSKWMEYERKCQGSAKIANKLFIYINSGKQTFVKIERYRES